MENPGILNWRAWSIPRKGLFLGAVVGASVTVLSRSLLMLAESTVDAGSPLEVVAWIVFAATLAVDWPTHLFFQVITRLSSGGYDGPKSDMAAACFAFAINTLGYAALGASVGYVWIRLARVIRRTRRK
jgi:hypothetical protein